MDDLQILVQTVLDEIKSLQSIQAQLEKIGNQATLSVSAELDIPKSLQRIRRDIESLEKLHVDLTGRLNRSESRKAIKKDLKALGNEQVAVKVKVDKAELKKSLKEAGAKATTIDVDTNVEGTEDLEKVSDGLDGINKKSAATVASVTFLNQALIELEQAAKKMIQTSAQLDEKLTDLRMVTGDSYEEASALVAKYNDLAKSLGATTKDVLDASSDWLRQGHDVSETNELIRNSMILSKVSNLESAEATEYLTSAMKGYKVAVEDVVSIVDKLTAVDLVSATDAGGLAEAMSKTAVVADNAGVSMDKLLGYLAVVGEVTGDMSSVGNAFKTIFTRMSDIKDGKLELIDEDGTTESLSNVETVLDNLGIKLRESNNEFRNFGDVLDEVAASWDTYSSVQRAMISDAFAGTRQSNNFQILMSNYAAATAYMETAANSAGTAEKKFSAYLESLRAKIESFNAAFESLSMNTFDAQFMGGLVDAATALIEFIDGINLLQAALVGLSAAGILKGFTMIANSAKNVYNDVLKLSTAFDIMGKAMVDSFDNVTAAKARYDAAMSVQEKDTNFKSYAEAFAELNAQFEAGTTNSNAFWAAAEFLFGSDQLAAWGWRDGLDEIYQAMESNRSVFEDADSAGAGFIDRLYEMAEAGELVNEKGEKLIEITKEADGGYKFNVEPENITAIADAMNLTEEAVLACFQALSMWGNVNFYDIMDVVGKLKEMQLIADTADGQAVNFSRLTEQLLALGKTDLEIADLTSALQNQGVTLLAVTDNVDTLTTNLQELGLAASDGVTITVDYEGLANLMSQIGFTKEETQNLITTLGNADGISLANASGEVQGVTDALAHIDTLTFDTVTSNIGGVSSAIGDVNESSTDNAVSEISAVGSAAETAASKVYSIGSAIDSVNGRTCTVYYNVERKGSILGMFGFAKGTKDAPAGDALVGEEGVELWQSGDKARLVGVNGPEIVNLNKGDKIYPNPMTKKMMSKSGKNLSGTIPAYALGLNVRPYAVAMNDGGGGSSSSSKKTESTVASAVAAAVTGAVTGAVNAAKGAVSGSVNTGKNKTGSTGSNKSNSSGGGGSGGSGSSNSSSGDGFEEQYKEHQHLLAMDQESIEDYLAWLNQAYKDAYANGEIELDDYYKCQEEVYSKLQDLFKDYLSDTEHQIDMMSNYEGSDAEIISMYQELMKAIEKEVAAARAAGLDDSDEYIQELQKKWMDYFGKVADIQEEVTDNAKDAADGLVDFRIDMLKQELEARRDALNTQLDDLRDFYDEQKDMLQEQYDHEKYLEEQAEKRRSVTDIQAQLDQLKYDDSAWAQKRKLELEEELSAAQKDLSDFERDNSLDEAMKFLDAQYEQQELLIQEELAAIEAQLNDPAALYNQALNDIKNNTRELYEQMVEYNNKYGDGNPETVKEMWENAYVALKEYIDLFGEAYKDIALANATDYKELDDSWDTNPVSGTNPDNLVTQPTTPSTPKEEEKKSSAPSLEKGSTITVKKSATHFSSKSGSVRMASFVPGGKYTVYQTSGNEVLIGRDGVYTGWIKKTDIVGYASGTKYASAGFHRFDERGSEYIFSDQGGDKYRLFSSGEKVLDAESANFLYDFASKKGVGIVDKIIAGIFGSADSIADRIAGSAYGSKENLSRAIRSVTDNRVINNNVDMSGDINIQGNASEKTVSDMRREKREMIEYVLKELNRMGAEEVRRIRR